MEPFEGESYTPMEISFHEDNPDVPLDENNNFVVLTSDENVQQNPAGEKPVQPDRQTNWSCRHCDYVGQREHLLKQHTRRCHTEKRHRCTKCTKVYSFSCDLERHTSRRHGQGDPVICEYCGQLFKDEATRRRHKRSKHDVNTPQKTGKNFECSVCKRVFHTKNHLEGHLNKHFDMKPFKCSVCNSKFGYESAKNSHEKSCGIREKKFTCTQCEQSFASKRCLSAHVKGKHTKYGVRCSVCNKWYKWKTNLTRHEKIHKSQMTHTNE